LSAPFFFGHDVPLGLRLRAGSVIGPTSGKSVDCHGRGGCQSAAYRTLCALTHIYPPRAPHPPQTVQPPRPGHPASLCYEDICPYFGSPPVGDAAPHRQRQRMSLRVSRLDGRVTLSLPIPARVRQSDDLLLARSGRLDSQSGQSRAKRHGRFRRRGPG
jgi:hypothetical protein